MEKPEPALPPQRSADESFTDFISTITATACLEQARGKAVGESAASPDTGQHGGSARARFKQKLMGMKPSGS